MTPGQRKSTPLPPEVAELLSEETREVQPAYPITHRAHLDTHRPLLRAVVPAPAHAVPIDARGRQPNEVQARRCFSAKCAGDWCPPGSHAAGHCLRCGLAADEAPRPRRAA